MSAELVIDSCRIADDTDCYVIAEIGHNHQGDMAKAKLLIKTAHDCGVNAVKFQKRDNRTLYTKAMYDSLYDNENSFGTTYGEHREALEFNAGQYEELKKYSEDLGVSFFATAWDFPSADLLARLDVPAYKIASGDLTNTPLLRHIARIGKPMIVSTGGAPLDDVRRAYDTITALNPQVALLQCTASYPTEPEEMNLRVIETFRREFPSAVVGLSDHQDGIAMAVVGFALGARVVEKHFTLHRSWKGTDHAFSLEPIGMQKLVRDLRRARVALGDGVKRVLPTETKPLYKMRKKLVAARNLPAGHQLEAADVAIKSPGDGLSPQEFDRVIGMVTTVPLAADENLVFEKLAEPASTPVLSRPAAARR